MAITDKKITGWLNAVSDEADRPLRSAAEMKGIFDSNSNQLKAALNGLIDALVSPMGAQEIGAEAMSGISAGTLRSQLLALRTLIDQRIASISIGTVTTAQTGTPASVSVTGEAPDITLNFVLPKGDTGNNAAPHAAQHAIGQEDALSPEAIGAASTSHAQSHATDGGDVLLPQNIGAIAASQRAQPNGVATLDESGKVVHAQSNANVETVSQSTTLALNHAGKLLLLSCAATITIPAYSEVAFVQGTEIELCQYGEGVVNIVGAEGVTLNGVPAGAVQTVAQYACVALKKIGTDEWIAAGGLE